MPRLLSVNAFLDWLDEIIFDETQLGVQVRFQHLE